MGAMGICRQGWHVPMPGRTRFDPPKKAKVEMHVSKAFPLGRWEVCKVSVARTCCS
jgi:hypothetical protein